MASINVQVWDATGNTRFQAELPDDVPVDRLLVRLTEKMNLPAKHPDGRMLVYKFHHATAGQLRDTQSLRAAGVKESDVLRLFHEMIAG